jgi:hypothetical protein
MIEALPEKTGKSLDEWKQVIAQAGWTSHGEIVKGLKCAHDVSHAYANQIALKAVCKPEAAGDPIEEMFAKRPEVRPIYDAVLAQITSFGTDVDLAPKKGYVSVRRSKQFAILQPASGRLDVGIQLKDVSPSGRLEPSGSFNAMLSHRVRVTSIAEVDAQLVAWLRLAYERA